MKKVILSLTIILIAFSVVFAQSDSGKNAKTAKKNKNAPEITFKETTHDYGTIKRGGDGTFEFVFKNTGKEPLVLSNVKSSCGCTVPTWPREPVKRKKEASIKVKYDTNRMGRFTKSITVYSNAKNSPVSLIIKGTVVQ